MCTGNSSKMIIFHKFNKLKKQVPTTRMKLL